MCPDDIFPLKYRVTPKKYTQLTRHEIIAFCAIVYIFLDSEYLFIDDFDISITQIRQKLVEKY